MEYARRGAALCRSDARRHASPILDRAGVKSVITAPSGGQMLIDKGYYEITGLAWSRRGKVRRVDVSTDGGRNWRAGAAAGTGTD